MLKVEGGGVPINPPPPSRLRVTIFSRRLLGLIVVLNLRFKYGHKLHRKLATCKWRFQ